MIKKEAKSHIENCRKENHKDVSKLIISVSWAVSALIFGLNFKEFSFFGSEIKALILISFLLFSAALLLEFFAGLSFIKCCELNEQKSHRDILFFNLGIWAQRIRNASFVIAFAIFITTTTICFMNNNNKNDTPQYQYISENKKKIQGSVPPNWGHAEKANPKPNPKKEK